MAGSEKAYTMVEDMSARVRALLQEIDGLVRPPEAETPPDDQMEL